MEDSSSFCIVDEAGEVVPPEEESSVLAAVAVEVEGGGGMRPYTEDAEAFNTARESAWLRLAAALRESTLGDPSIEEDCASDDDGVDCEDSDGGDEGFSREATNNDGDEWDLEAILSRRSVSHAKGGSDYKEFYDDFGEKKTGMLMPGRVEYLCKWRGYAEPTWEVKEVLEDLGFVREHRAFEAQHRLRHQPAVPSTSPKWTELSDKDTQLIPDDWVPHRERTERGRDTLSGIHPLYRMRPPSIRRTELIEKLASENFLQDVSQLVSEAGYVIRHFGAVLSEYAVSRFLGHARRLSSTHRPVILFHATQLHNLATIARKGLRVPGSEGVKVVHGNAYGVGIYAAMTPAISATYCDYFPDSPTIRILVCVGLVSANDPNVAIHNQFVVFKDSELICTPWVIDMEGQRFSSSNGCAVPKEVVFTPANLGISLTDDAGSGIEDADQLPAAPSDEQRRCATLTKVSKRNIRQLKKWFEIAQTHVTSR